METHFLTNFFVSTDTLAFLREHFSFSTCMTHKNFTWNTLKCDFFKKLVGKDWKLSGWEGIGFLFLPKVLGWVEPKSESFLNDNTLWLSFLPVLALAFQRNNLTWLPALDRKRWILGGVSDQKTIRADEPRFLLYSSRNRTKRIYCCATTGTGCILGRKVWTKDGNFMA